MESEHLTTYFFLVSVIVGLNLREVCKKDSEPFPESIDDIAKCNK